MRDHLGSSETPWHPDEDGRRERQYDNAYRRRSPDRRRSERSRSPSRIDRYQPDRDGFQRPRNDRRRPSPGPPMIDRYVPGQAPRRENPVPDPHKSNTQIGFTYFAEWWRQEEMLKGNDNSDKAGKRRRGEGGRDDKEAREERDREKAEIQKAYDEYKEKLQMKLGRQFVQDHKAEEWFKDRYDLELRIPWLERLREDRKEIWNTWYQDLENGAFDEFSLEGIYKQDSDGAGGVIEREEGEAVGAGEVLNVGDLVPLKGGDMRDESIFQPTLLIKTIAPTVSRASLEEFCHEHLGDGEAGFRWLSLSDPNPNKRFHRIGWVLLNPGGDDRSTVLKNRNEGEEGDEDGNVQEGNDELSGPAERAVAAINGKTVKDEVRGDFVCHVGTHTIRTEFRKKALWDLFSAPDRIERDLDLCIRVAEKMEAEQGVPFSGIEKIGERIEYLREQGMLQPVSSSVVSRKPKVEGDMDMDAEEGEEKGEAVEDEVDDEELTIKKKKLDILVEYLRRVYNFCFFCVFECDSVQELMRKCPGGHLRRPRAGLTSTALITARASALGEEFPDLNQTDPVKEEAPEDGEMPGSPTIQKSNHRGQRSKSESQLYRAFGWVKTYEEKLQMVIDPDNVDLRKLGGKPLDEALEDELQKFVKQEDENKFRCKVPECTKLFKGESFWRKHVEKRHVEWYESQKKDLELVNRYVLDPGHVVPPRPENGTNGQFPSHGAMLPYSTSTPRGFGLPNMPPSFNPMNGVSPMTMMGMPGAPFFSGYPMQMPGNRYGPQPTGMMNGMGRPGVGPVRRGGGDSRIGSRYVRGPYDRPSGPPRMGSGMNGGSMARAANRWGDGGGGTMGPREAVQGRSLKSYEDLDAVDQGAKANSELNY